MPIAFRLPPNGGGRGERPLFMSNYTFQPKGDHLTIFKNKKKMHTPKGNIIYTYSEDFANRIIKELEAEADYTSCASILCYHYTYCDLTAEYDQRTVAEDLLTCLDNNVEYDPIIALNETKEIEAMSDEEVDKLVKTFKQQMMAFIGGCSMSQLVAITVLYCAFDSLALPYYIVKDTMGKEACSIDDFVAKLSAYCKREGIDIPSNMQATITAFSEYWNI